MSTRLKVGIFIKIDGEALEDFEPLPVGPITQLPQIIGTGGCTLKPGVFLPRQ